MTSLTATKLDTDDGRGTNEAFGKSFKYQTHKNDILLIMLSLVFGGHFFAFLFRFSLSSNPSCRLFFLFSLFIPYL